MPVTTDTPTELIVGAGEVYRNQRSLGASTEANVFRIERELFTPEINGVKGMLIGTDYITRTEGDPRDDHPRGQRGRHCRPPGRARRSAVVGGTTTIDEDDARRIPTAAYADWELQVERLGGGEFQFEVDNAIHFGQLRVRLHRRRLVRPALRAQSRWDPADLTISPHRIRILTSAS